MYNRYSPIKSGNRISVLFLILFAYFCLPLSTSAAAESPPDIPSPGLKVAPEKQYIWLETELFPEKGGWSVDSQFFETMGSAYLLATGLGSPVPDARTPFHVDRDGRYALWMRTKNWLPPFNPGRFQVLIDGENVSRECGIFPQKQWVWEKGGEIELSAGTHSLALKDLTGAYGRCDVVLITDDLEFIPPLSIPEIALLRERFLPGTDHSPVEQEYDVIVMGGGVGGVCAALAAAREGCRVVLIQNRPVLGGNASTEIGVGPAGAYAGGVNPYYLETGLIRELHRSRVPHYTWDQVLREAIDKENNITCFMNTQATRAIVGPPGHIHAVETVNLISGKNHLFQGKIFLDCTGDGGVAVSAGADYRHGREARDEFGESLAPKVADRRTMGTTLMFGSIANPEPTVFQRPDWAHDFPTYADIPHRLIGTMAGGFWWLEYGGTRNTILDAEEIRDELLRIVYGVWDFLKYRYPATRKKCRNRSLGRVGYIAGKRESRRLMGDYILSQNDLETHPHFFDRVAYGGWPIDLHTPKGIFDPGYPNIQQYIEPYSIPFRSLYSRNIDNLMFAGRNISVSHVALGSTRVINTIATCAQAIGTAAALCLKYDLSPRELGKKKIVGLQQALLKNDLQIFGIPNLDPRDLARDALIIASSYAKSLPCTPKTMIPSGRSHPLNFYRAVMFPAPAQKIDSISILLKSENKSPVPVKMGLRKAPAFGQFEIAQEPFTFFDKTNLAVAEVMVPPGGPHWVTGKIDTEVQPKDFYWVYLEPAPGISWMLTDRGLPWSCRGFRTGAWENAGNRNGIYCLAVSPPLNYEGTSPENIINGLKWPRDMEFNLWASDPEESFPQWIELKFPKEREFNKVMITFDTGFTPPTNRQPRSSLTVQSYHIQIPDDGGWKTLVSVSDNRHRFQVHEFERVKADRMRVLITGTNGDRSARIYEVRIYNSYSSAPPRSINRERKNMMRKKASITKALTRVE
jgi:FAD dependent oxidoreductase/F5/8 type C domain